MDKFIEKQRPDGTIEYVNINYDKIVQEVMAQESPKPGEYIEIPEDELERWKSTKYQRDRLLEYPPIGDQLDALFKAGVFPEEMAAQIQAVKDKYPKV